MPVLVQVRQDVGRRVPSERQVPEDGHQEILHTAQQGAEVHGEHHLFLVKFSSPKGFFFPFRPEERCRSDQLHLVDLITLRTWSVFRSWIPWQSCDLFSHPLLHLEALEVCRECIGQ